MQSSRLRWALCILHFALCIFLTACQSTASGVTPMQFAP